MSNLSIYILILAIYIVLHLFRCQLNSIDRKVDLIMKFEKFIDVSKFKDDKEFLEFLLNSKECGVDNDK